MSGMLCLCLQEAITHSHMRWSPCSSSSWVGGKTASRLAKAGNAHGFKLERTLCTVFLPSSSAASPVRLDKSMAAAQTTDWTSLAGISFPADVPPTGCSN